MDSISKRRREHFERASVEGTEDRISNLPTSLISHILSFLPTKNAVATSVLSTKWKYLWSSITNLDFDDGLVVVLTNPLKSIKQRRCLVEMSFINFVYRVLSRTISDLQKFRLRCIRSYDVSHLNSWVSTALSRNLRELHLSNIIWSLPRELFTCASLVVLKLGGTHGTFVLNIPTSVCLQSLKILVIDSLRFLDDDSIYRLFSSCPVLEDLSIEECDCRNMSVINISAPALRNLTINCRSWFDDSGMLYEYDSDDSDDSHFKYKFVLNTPNLQDLKYKEYVEEIYSVNKLNALVKANISFSEGGLPVCERFIEKPAIAEFVERISRVQWLYLSSELIEIFQLCRFPFPLPKFYHLTYLELGDNCRNVRWKLLLDFVESSPRLETLIFGGLSREENRTTSRWYQLQHVPSCLLFHLKKIEIKQFSGDSPELKMAKYFLKNSRVLEKLTLHPCWNPYLTELELCKEVLMLPRRSKTCQVEEFNGIPKSSMANPEKCSRSQSSKSNAASNNSPVSQMTQKTKSSMKEEENESNYNVSSSTNITGNSTTGSYVKEEMEDLGKQIEMDDSEFRGK